VSREAYVTVTVGFAPATTPGLVTGGTTADTESGAPQGLFAALLAMLAPGQAIDAAADATVTDAADKITSADFAALIQTLAAEATSPAKEPEAAEGEPEEADAPEDSSDATAIAGKLDDPDNLQGKSLLKDLGDALLALNDSIAAGQPIDPALEKKLNEAVDALAIYLGALTPTATSTTRISALAGGDGAIPVAGDPPPAPAAPPVPAPSPAVPVEVAPTAPETGPSVTTDGAPEAPEPFAQLVADLAPDIPDAADAPDATLPQPAPAKGATTLEEAPAALRALGLVIGKLSEKLAAQDPELAKKLDAFAETLKSGALPEALKTALGPDATATERELKRIVEALATPRPAAAKPVETKTFSPPTLELPPAVAAPAKKDEPTTAVAAAPEPAPKLEPSEPELARPVTASNTAKIEKPEATDSKPVPAAAAPSPTQTAATDPAAAAASQTPPAAAPVARTIHAAYQAPLQQVNLPQVAFEVVRQFEAGNTRFQIRLDPPELGRIDVKLDVDKSGTVNARLTVERPETLDLMQRDQRALQQALQQAGLDGQKTNLEFSLRQNPFAQQGGMADGRGEHSGYSGRGDSFAGGDEVAVEAATTTYRGTASASGLNLFV